MSLRPSPSTPQPISSITLAVNIITEKEITLDSLRTFCTEHKLQYEQDQEEILLFYLEMYKDALKELKRLPTADDFSTLEQAINNSAHTNQHKRTEAQATLNQLGTRKSLTRENKTTLEQACQIHKKTLNESLTEIEKILTLQLATTETQEESKIITGQRSRTTTKAKRAQRTDYKTQKHNLEQLATQLEKWSLELTETRDIDPSFRELLQVFQHHYSITNFIGQTTVVVTESRIIGLETISTLNKLQLLYRAAPITIRNNITYLFNLLTENPSINITSIQLPLSILWTEYQLAIIQARIGASFPILLPTTPQSEPAPEPLNLGL